MTNASSLPEEYLRAESRKADVVHDFNQERENYKRFACIDVPLIAESSIAQKQGVEDAFVVAQLLTEEECEDLIKKAELAGLVPANKNQGTPRTAKRTDNYQDQDLSSVIESRIGATLQEERKMDSNSSFGEFYGLHNNWRILRYDARDSFPAHQDQMDSIRMLDKATGKTDMVVSSHTLIINLSGVSGEGGGATRFYPRCKVGGKLPSSGAGGAGPYDYSVDVVLPRGWALAFPQVGMVHAGQPLKNTAKQSKYIAQAGILRKLPPTKVLRPSVFRLGPGLQ